MKRVVGVATAALLSAAVANAQYWKALGKGTIGPTEIQTLYGDSISNRLLAGGTFTFILNDGDTVLGMGQAAWNGSRWDSLAYRIAPSVGQTFWFLRFQDKLYACGGYLFYDDEGNVNSSFAQLNENTLHWNTLACTNPYPLSGLLTLVPKEPQNTLYATGYMGSICGYTESCVFRYDGSAFHVWEPFNLIPDGNDNYVGTVFDFQGKTYMTCSLRDPLGPGYVSFLRWNGTTWEHVPGWNTLSTIKEILIHNDTLYVAGTFTLTAGGPGNLVAAFSNDQWNNMGGGLYYTPVPMSGAALDLEWFHGELWASGIFSKAGNADCTGIAHWDGHRWCVPPGVILHANGQYGEAITDMAIWRDSLYICGGFATIDGVPIRQVAQWVGGDAVGDCSTMGIDEAHVQNPQLGVVPLVEPGLWCVQLPDRGAWTLDVFDVMGRNVGQWKANGIIVLDLSARSPGMYLLRATGPTGALRNGKLVRP